MEDFLLLDEHLHADEKQWREKVRRFVHEEVNGVVAEAFEQAQFMRQFIPRMAELGLLGMTLPGKVGGAGANYVAYGLVCQELEAGDSSLRSFISVQNSLCMYPIFAFGSPEQKHQWLPKMAKGEAIGCFALSEINAGSDPASMQTTATKISGGWELNGSKKWITNAPIADLAIVWAKTDTGIRGFLVETNSPGFKTKVIEHKMSLRTSITGEIFLENCKVAENNLLPGTDKGLVAALECLTQARFSIAWGAMGAAAACYEVALEYCKTRKQFAKPLAGFQLVQKDLANMFTEIVKAQCLNLQVARLKDAGKSNYAIISMAKMNACKQALAIARNARDLLGANGITLNYPVIRHMQNLEAVSTYEGTDNIHHLILGKYLTGVDAFG
jgi:glutaryl-CoA dehydrogenase